MKVGTPGGCGPVLEGLAGVVGETKAKTPSIPPTYLLSFWQLSVFRWMHGVCNVRFMLG